MTSTTRIVLVAEHCWDGMASEPTGPTAIIVERGKIVAIGPAEVSIPAEEVIDLGALTLLPGLIDCHVHLLDEAFDTRPAAAQVLTALPPMRTLLNAGFTTVRDLGGARGALNVALRQAQEQRTIEGPRLIVAPNILSAPGGHGDKKPELTQRLGVDVGVVANSADQLRGQVREQARVGADWIKFAASGGFTSPADDPDQVAFSVEEMASIVDTARDFGLPCAAHAFNSESVIRALQAGVRSIEHANLASAEVFSRIADHDAYLVPTLHSPRYFIDNLDDDEFWSDSSQETRASVRDHADQILESSTYIAGSGVRIAFGTDAGMFPHSDNWREFEAMVDVGIPPLKALCSATSTAAELLSRPDLGHLAAGATADIVAVRGDPFTDISALSRVEFVMQEGRVHRALSS
ncbi:imidazolonepropionase-like amidohydrolase [Nocardia tenerifensis]|uniref:Imidazolonepropionase-like amidohydrolase n=1 Tax=Nocardia tenerifensis TaxID=228006 RepID=A0A318JUT0_9NOCA|nr:amidohydrolase family protein [Nocardia tenerifensis]PXX60854.1 imidazolonepropionase-like amidohydrolase [Nocardia tenerifensis]